jgi:hypothetical protein
MCKVWNVNIMILKVGLVFKNLKTFSYCLTEILYTRPTFNIIMLTVQNLHISNLLYCNCSLTNTDAACTVFEFLMMNGKPGRNM